jgi:hypothetical protein
MSFDQRSEERYNFPYTIEYVLNPSTTDEILEGVAINISKSGLCLYTHNLLREGQEITIKSIMPTSSQNAIVKWIEKIDHIYYKVGLVFV